VVSTLVNEIDPPRAGLVGIDDLVGYLTGEWALSRALVDFAGASRGRFEGRARFELDTDGSLAYREEGELTFDGYRGRATRAYRYLPTGTGEADVCFGDGRPFFHLDLRTGCASARHRCGEDTYVGLHLARGSDCFETRWRVLGPQKALLLATTAHRRR